MQNQGTDACGHTIRTALEADHTPSKQVRLVNNAIFGVVLGVSCGLLETTNVTHHGPHEQKAQHSQPDNDAVTCLRGQITAQHTTLSALVLESASHMVLWRPE